MFSCILAVHVWKEAFSVFIVSRLLYLFLSKILGGWTKVVPLCFWKVGDVGNWEEGGEESVSIPAGEGSGLQTQTKNEFSRDGRWDRKEDLTRSTSTLF